MRVQQVLLGVFAFCLMEGMAHAQAPEQGVEFFEKKVRPVLFEKCLSCHGEKVQQGRLRLDNRASFLKGGERGAIFVVNAPEKSLLLHAVQYRDPNLQMPPKGKLSEEQIAALTDWIKMGAPYPSNKTATKPSASPFTGIDIKARAQHWTFRPLLHPAVPFVKQPKWAKTPIDNFILAKLEGKGIVPNAPADKYTLLRRVTYDLTGLPPTPKEVQDFIADKSPKAYENVVDRLLTSPHYGEKWGRHWLDLMRFAETDGHEFDFEKPGAYQYRDYVIRAFNANVPYNQFVIEHLAGDLLTSPRKSVETPEINESILATGWWWLGEGKHSPVDLRVDQAERTDNQIDVLGKTFLGLSFGCVKCHDHKFDPLTQKDYYSLAGIVNSTRYHLMPNVPPNQKEAARELSAIRNRVLPTTLYQQRLQLWAKARHLKPLLLETKNGVKLTGQGTPTLHERWQSYLSTTAKNDPINPFYAWAVLAKTTPLEYPKRREQVVQQLRDLSANAERIRNQQTLFEDFSKGYEGWYSTGAAFGDEPHRLSFITSESEPAVTAVLGSGIADSGATSTRFAGTLRSKTFDIGKKYVHIRMQGSGGCFARMIIEGFQRIQFPIYGGLRIEPNTPEMRWYTMDVSKWVGLKGYIEFLDNGAGRIAVDEITFSDSQEVSNPPDSYWLQRLAGEQGRNLDTLAETYQSHINSAIQYLRIEPENGEFGERYAPFTNWILRNFPLIYDMSVKGTNSPAAASEWVDYQKREQAIPIGELIQVAQDGTGVDERVQLRGNPKSLGVVSPRRFIEVFFGTQSFQNRELCGRLELAQKLVSPQNPLLPRVIANRIWHYHFGRGIVKTVDDFGLRSDTPSHRELLDWLANDLIRNGWSIKHLHRLILLSSTYQMRSDLTHAKEAKDPSNQLLHRMPVRRLEAEEVRDGILAVSGRLDKTMFGHSIFPHLTTSMEGRGRPGTSGPLDGKGRRSIYIGVRRNFLSPMFLAFDYPIPFNTMGRRSVSNVPAQALVLMNNPFVVEQSKLWAERVVAQNQSDQAKIQEMYLTAFGRPAKPNEIATALEFLKSQAVNYGQPIDARAWQDLCHVLFNVKEFLFVQ